MSEDLRFATIAELSKRNDWTGHDLECEIDRAVTAGESALRVFVTLVPTEQRVRKPLRGSLAGIPVTVKDNICTANIRTTACSRTLESYVPAQDAGVVARLRSAGAVVIGKTWTFEFAVGAPRANDLYPSSRNPWDLSRSPTGSSGGSAVAVAAGLGPLSIGTDTGGSIRSPAAWCGVVGYKPTNGLLSNSGVVTASWTLDSVGTLTRCVADARIAVGAMGAIPGEEKQSIQLRDLRIGYPKRWIESIEGISSDVVSSVDVCVRALARHGVRVVDVPNVPWDVFVQARLAILRSEAYAYHRRRGFAGLGKGLLEFIEPAASANPADYIDALHVRDHAIREFTAHWRNFDLLLTPTLPITARTFAEMEKRAPVSLAIFTQLANLIGSPSISIPCGLDKRGLPIGVLLTGASYQDHVLLEVADKLESLIGFRIRLSRLEGQFVERVQI